MVDVQLDFDFASDYYFFYFYIYSSEMYLGRYQISIGIVFLRKSLTAFATIINIWLVPNGHQLSVALFWTYLILVSPLIHALTVLLFDILRKNLLDSKTSSTEYLFWNLGKFSENHSPRYYFLMNFETLYLKHKSKSSTPKSWKVSWNFSKTIRKSVLFSKILSTNLTNFVWLFKNFVRFFNCYLP